MYRTAFALVCVLAILTVAAAPNCVTAEQARKKVIVVAHRGAHDQAPENSLAAIRNAANLGCDYVEVDVRTTSDHQLVLMHDSAVDRTTNGKGQVADLTLAEIRKLRFNTGSPDERVPTFDEALSACKGKIKVYVDHKDASPADVLAAVKRHNMLANVVVYGSVETLRKYKELDHAVWIMPPHPDSARDIRRLVADLKPETLDGNVVEWTTEHAKAAYEAGAQVWVDFPEPFNSEAGVRRAIELDVDAIQTDQPDRLIKLLKSHKLR